MSGGKVLVVDDNYLSRQVLRRLICLQLGVEASFVESGEESLRVLREVVVQPRMILLDVCLRGSMDGYETCQAIRQLELELGVRSPVPIVLMSSVTQPFQKARIQKAGGNGFIEKPIRVQMVHEVFAKCNIRINLSGAQADVPEDGPFKQHDGVKGGMRRTTSLNSLRSAMQMADLNEPEEEEVAVVDSGEEECNERASETGLAPPPRRKRSISESEPDTISMVFDSSTESGEALSAVFGEKE